MKQDKEKFWVDCSCGCSTIRLTLWKDMPEDVEMGMLRYSNWGNSTWRQRLSYIWRALRYGELSEDSILLVPEDVKKLSNELNKMYKQQKELLK